MSPQAVSSHIQRLEEECETPLFERSTRQLRLTYAGERVLEHAQKILENEEEMMTELSDIANLRTGRLSLGTSQIRGRVILPDLLTAYMRQYPSVRIITHNGITEDPNWNSLDVMAKVNLMSDSLCDDIARIHSAAPDAALDYAFTLYGTAQNLANETVNLSHVPVGDRGAAVTSVLPFMTRCTYLDMDTCGVGHEDMDAIRQAFPAVNVVWRVNFKGYSVRTDCERILASKPSIAGELHDEDVVVLKYCNGCKYLDLGHNESLTNIDFVYGMPNLEVAIIAMNPIRDLTPIASCKHLEYLETQTTSVTDLSPLAELKELRHLNICKLSGLTDISPLYNLPDLMRLWIGCITPIPAEQVARMQEIAPDCQIDTEVVDPTTGDWRITGYIRVSLPLYSDLDFEQEVFHPRYYLLQEQFGYKDRDFAFASNDPLY